MIKAVSTGKTEPWFTKLNISKCEAINILTDILLQRGIKYKIEGYRVLFDEPTNKLPEIMKEFEEMVKEYV